MNKGLDIKGQITVNYDGTYVSASDDIFGKTGDDVTINFDIKNPNPYSVWNATNRKITVGEAGTAKFNVGSGNHVLSQDTVVGEVVTGNGTVNIYNAGTYWKNTDNFVIGDIGTGTLNLGAKDADKSSIYHGAELHTGNFSLGGKGKANITGNGTILNIFGTSASLTGLTGGGTNATMIVDDRAQVYLNSTKGDAYMELAGGTSTFDNAYFQLDRGFIDATNNDILFQNNAMFEGSTWDWDTHANYSKIDVNSLTIDDAVFSPGFGNKVYWDKGGALDFSEADMVDMYYTGKYAGDARFGYIDTSALTLNADSVSIFDFDVQGDLYHAGNSGNDVYEHKDYVIAPSITVGGHIHFRPMSGFYRDDIEIQALDDNITGSFDSITIWPKRWFENVDIAPNTGTLTMSRHTSPFNSSGEHFNEKSVGTALDVIYNNRQANLVDDVLADQQQDEWFPVLDWVWGKGDHDFRMSMRQLAGEARVSSFYMPLRSPWRYGFDRTNWRKRDNHIYFGQQSVNTPMVEKNSLWVTPYYDYQHMSEDNNISGANISRVSFMAGYDRVIGRQSAVGFLFGYSQPKMDQGSSRVIADDYLFALHASTRVSDDYELKLWGSYGTQNYRLSRHVSIGNGESVNTKYSGNSWAGSVQLARPFNYRKGVIRPLVAMDYSYIKQNDAVENGYFPIALKYHSSDWSQLFARAGVRGDFAWSRFNVTGSATYSYQFAGDVMPTCTNQFLIDGPAFEIQGNNLSRSFVNIGLGTQAYLNKLKSRMLFVQYNGVYGSRMNSQNASLGYQMIF